MLAIQRAAEGLDQCTLNVVPCRIHRDGPTKITKRFWSPSIETDGSRTAYFRGRKLRGRIVKLPPGYQGLVLKPTTKCLPQIPAPSVTRSFNEDDGDLNDDIEEERPEPVKIVEEASNFEELRVWGHDQIPATDDPFIKGIQEWISFAEAVHDKEEDSKLPDTYPSGGPGA